MLGLREPTSRRADEVMELCTGGELFERIVAESEKHAARLEAGEGAAATHRVTCGRWTSCFWNGDGLQGNWIF